MESHESRKSIGECYTEDDRDRYDERTRTLQTFSAQRLAIIVGRVPAYGWRKWKKATRSN